MPWKLGTTIEAAAIKGAYSTNSHSDVFSSGIWSDLSIIEGPQLQKLSQSPSSLVLQGNAVSTIKKSSGAYYIVGTRRLFDGSVSSKSHLYIYRCDLELTLLYVPES